MYEEHVKVAFTSRLLLCEVGYQAGQHELLSESLGKKLQKNIFREFFSRKNFVYRKISAQ